MPAHVTKACAVTPAHNWLPDPLPYLPTFLFAGTAASSAFSPKYTSARAIGLQSTHGADQVVTKNQQQLNLSSCKIYKNLLSSKHLE